MNKQGRKIRDDNPTVARCAADGCCKAHESKGYCAKHYTRIIRQHRQRVIGPKGFGTISRNGYVVHNSGGKNYLEHVAIAEHVLGKKLPCGAIVHHANGNRLDNRPENLVICPSRAYHSLLHARMRAYEACENYSYRKCVYCKTYDAPESMYKRPNLNHFSHRKCAAAFMSYKKRHASAN